MISNFPCLLELREKDATYFFHITDQKVLYRTALGLLSQRAKNHRWYTKPSKDEVEQAFGKLGMTEEEINCMPDGYIKNKALDFFKSYTNLEKELENRIKQYEEIEDAIKHADGKLAWKILTSRGKLQYEYVMLHGYTALNQYRY